MPRGIFKHKPLSEEHKRKLSEAHKGKPNHRLGTHLSEKTKKKLSEKLMGRIISEETKRKMGKAKRGNKNCFWKDGFTTNANGYKLFKIPEGCRFSSMKNKDGYVYIHRLMAAKELQRPLTPNEIVHHKGIKYPMNSIENRQDNRIENLELCNGNGEHLGLHKKWRRRMVLDK